MYAKLTGVFVTLLLALVSWSLRDDIPTWAALGVSTLLLLGALIQVILIVRERTDQKKARYSGKLRRTTGEVIISADDHVYPKLELGDSGAIFVYAGDPGKPLFSFFENSHLTVIRDGNRVLVSTDIFDQEGHLVARLALNEWQVNPNVSFDRNYMDDALEVMDQGGDVVLQVRLVEDRIQLQGKFYGPDGRGVAFGKGTNAVGKTVGVMEMTGPNNPVLKMKISPIFRYPSNLHLGEIHAP